MCLSPFCRAILIVVVVLGLLFWWVEPDGSPTFSHDEIRGEVHDETGPVAGAVVRFKGKPASALTDEHGRFRLPRSDGATRITASKNGYLIAGDSASARPLIIHLSRLPAEDCERYAWVDPTPDPLRSKNCGNCHAAIYDEWQHSGHAHSATNRRFLDLYDDLLRDHPLGADVCSSCHSPTQKPGPFGEFDMRQAAKVTPNLSGVHCDFCHKVRGPGPGEYGLTHGRYQLSLLRPAPRARQLFFGPLDDVDRGEDTHSRFQRDSRACAACHEGVVFGVPVYTTYSEWLDSPAGRSGTSCQNCHMAPTGNMTNIAPGYGGMRRDPATLGNHRFFDGDRLDMLRRCLKVDVASHRLEHGIELNVAIATGDVGHRVPTGFIDRHLVLFVDVFAGDQSLGISRGPVLPDALGSEEAGRPGRLYARILADGKTATPLPFWKGTSADLTDTRLRPGESDRLTFLLPAEADRVRVRLVHRRFWKATAVSKRWPADEQAIFSQLIRLPGP